MQIRTARDIGAAIRERRRAGGWDQQTLADRIGVSRLWVSQMENGKPTVQLGLVLRAMAVLDIPLRIDTASAPAKPSRSADLIRKLIDER